MALMAVVVVGGMLTSCESEDGKWDPIKLTINGAKCKKSTQDVPVEGGVYKVYSSNYGQLWLIGVMEDGERLKPVGDEYSVVGPEVRYEGSWYDVRYDEAGNIVVSIDALPSGETEVKRSLYLDLESGDAFSSFTFRQ